MSDLLLNYRKLRARQVVTFVDPRKPLPISVGNPRGGVEYEMETQEIGYKLEKSVILKFRDLSSLNENADLRAKNKMIAYMSQSVSHEMLTPIKSIIEISKSLEKSNPDLKN